MQINNEIKELSDFEPLLRPITRDILAINERLTKAAQETGHVYVSDQEIELLTDLQDRYDSIIQQMKQWIEDNFDAEKKKHALTVCDEIQKNSNYACSLLGV